MAGAMRKMAVYLGLVEEEEGEHYDDYDGYDDSAHAGGPIFRKLGRRPGRDRDRVVEIVLERDDASDAVAGRA